MLSTTVIWYLATTILIAVWSVLYFRRGGSQALGIIVVLSFLVPVWIRIPILGEEISCRTMVAIVAVLGFCVYVRGRIQTPMTLLDIVISILWTVHLVADLQADGWSSGVPFRAYGEWILPYVAGRRAIHDRNDLKALVPWVVAVLAILSVCGLLECFLGINLFEIIAGDRPIDATPRNAARFGFKRAFGNAMHPIFFGNQIMLLAPWCFAITRIDSRKVFQVFGWLMLVLTFLGLCSTISRGPVLAFLIMLGVMAIVRFKILRWPALISVAATVAVLCIYPSATMRILGETVGAEQYKTLVEIDGNAREYTGTNARLLIFDAYGDALRHAGLTGYGTKLTTGFPPNIPYLQTSRHAVDRLKFVDNAYVLLTLRFGFLGMGMFALLLLIGIYTASSLTTWFPQWAFFPAVCGSLAGFALILLTVWLCHDFAFIALWTLGVLSGCAVLPIDRKLTQAFGKASH